MAGKLPDKIVYASGDPTSALNLAGTGVAVAVKIGGDDGATPEEIQKLKDAGIPIVIWQSQADQAGADAVKEYGAVGYIAQGESVDQMNAAAAIGNQIDVPKTIVTNGNYLPKWPPGWGVSIEFYQNVTDQSQQNLAEFIKTATAEGATSVNVVIGSWSANIPMDQYIQEIKNLQAQGIDINGVSAYIWTQMTPDQQKAFLDWMNQFNPSTAGPSPNPNPPPGSTSPPPKPPEKKPPEKTPPEKGGPGSGPGDGDGPNKGEPTKPKSSKKPETPNSTWGGGGGMSENTGGQSRTNPWQQGRPGAVKSEHLPDGTVISYMPSGAILEKSPNGTWYNTGKTWNPSGGGSDGSPLGGIGKGIAGTVGSVGKGVGDTGKAVKPSKGAPAPLIPNKDPPNPALAADIQQTKEETGQDPAWRKANKGWGDTDPFLAQSAEGNNPGYTDNKGNAFKASDVLESRPGADGSVIYRMSDGSYVREAKDGTLHNAGSWDNSGLTGATAANPSTQPASTTGGDFLGPGIATTNPPQTTTYSGKSASTTGGDFLGAPTDKSTATAPSSSPGPASTTGGDFLSGPATPAPSESSQSYTPDPVVPACFPAGTMVLTPTGHEPIERIRIGETVVTWDTQNNKAVPSKVTAIFKHLDKPTSQIVTTGGSITTTTEHRFWTGDNWLTADKLVTGTSTLFDNHGRPHRVTSIKPGPSQTVYNLHVTDPDHNYFADGFLVHNRKVDP